MLYPKRMVEIMHNLWSVEVGIQNDRNPGSERKFIQNGERNIGQEECRQECQGKMVEVISLKLSNSELRVQID
ncbi:jg20369 [Pararge aegeria aegeria]|uniref:Jg20369 protein n=1 Tax=Pararge aegeria aegeria TaxID=348720 RepID=A0A8S4QDQ4_9NEOP|nr:jg20369 [Pararge aegeria aegeria]